MNLSSLIINYIAKENVVKKILIVILVLGSISCFASRSLKCNSFTGKSSKATLEFPEQGDTAVLTYKFRKEKEVSITVSLAEDSSHSAGYDSPYTEIYYNLNGVESVLDYTVSYTQTSDGEDYLYFIENGKSISSLSCNIERVIQ